MITALCLANLLILINPLPILATEPVLIDVKALAKVLGKLMNKDEKYLGHQPPND